MQAAIQKELVYPAGSPRDEGGINWHSGGERWRESDGDPVDGYTLFHSIHHFFFLSENKCTVLCVFRVGWWQQEEMIKA